MNNTGLHGGVLTSVFEVRPEVISTQLLIIIHEILLLPHTRDPKSERRWSIREGNLKRLKLPVQFPGASCTNCYINEVFLRTRESFYSGIGKNRREEKGIEKDHDFR